MKDESEIQDMRDDAATQFHKSDNVLDEKFREGVRNALEWVLGDMEDGEIKDGLGISK